jgi:imidazolonepropionase
MADNVLDIDLLITGADAIVTPAGPGPLAGNDQRRVRVVERGVLAGRAGRILYVGRGDEAPAMRLAPDTVGLEAAGCTVVPGFVDPHTHAVFAGDRRHELQRRLAGATYAEIAAGGGGILGTVAATREATEDQLVDGAWRRLDEMLRCGTTTCEIKSGYGLETETELRMLRAIARLGERHPIDVVPTFMGAHEVPVEWRHDADGYVRVVADEMLPRVAAEGLAQWCDVFCEAGVFTPEQSERLLRAAAAHGLKPRIHADELAASGGSQVAARVGARSADHLVHADAESIAALRRGAVIATLLPAAAFYLKLGRFAPARELIAAGVPVAVATDINPGGGFTPSMPFVITLACFSMRMTLEEALVAATLNAACSLDLGDEVGSLEPGKLCDVVILRGGVVDLLRVGASSIDTVVKRGRVAWRAGR